MFIHNSMYNNKELSTLLNLVCSLFLFQILLFGDSRQNNFVTGIKINPFFFIFILSIDRKGVLSRKLPGLRVYQIRSWMARFFCDLERLK